MTLTQASALTKKTIIIGMVLTFLGIIGVIGYNIWYQSYLASLPPVEEKPEVKFGFLPDLQFPPSKVSSTNYFYSIDTITGELPQTPKIMKVYFIPRAGVTLLAPEKSQKLAAQLGFSNEPEKLSPTEHRFTNDNGDQLNIDLVTGNFHYQKAEATESALLDNPPLPKEEEILQVFRNFLTTSNLLSKDINSDQGLVIYNNSSTTEAKTATVSFLLANIDETPIITSRLNQGLINALLTGATDKTKMFLKIDYTYWSTDKTTFSTYPLKTALQAFGDLKAGYAFVIQEPMSPQVSIASVRLAYYESEEYIPYLQPVFVFEGPHFTALVPAINQTK